MISIINVVFQNDVPLVCDLLYLPATEDVFTVLFEYCRVSDSTQEWILENLIPNKLTSGFDNIWRHAVTSLAQVLVNELPNNSST